MVKGIDSKILSLLRDCLSGLVLLPEHHLLAVTTESLIFLPELLFKIVPEFQFLFPSVQESGKSCLFCLFVCFCLFIPLKSYFLFSFFASDYSSVQEFTIRLLKSVNFHFFLKVYIFISQGEKRE